MSRVGHASRVLVVLPSWVGDAVMATPALCLLRRSMPGAYIGGLVRPGIDRILGGLADDQGRAVFDEFHTHHPTGVLGPKFAAAKVRPRQYGSAVLLTNSFSTALAVRIAGVRRRVGYERDGRGVLLTERLAAPKAQGRAGSGYAVVPAVDYYWHAVSAFLEPSTPPLVPPALDHADRVELGLPSSERLRLAVTEKDQAEFERVVESIGLGADEAVAVINPGGNNPAKRWPVERFAAVCDHLSSEHGLRVLINGSPAEAEVCSAIAEAAATSPVVLSEHGGTLGSLKALCARAAVMVTNDTGPRHIAAAMGCPVVSLFGPTDPRWTTIPTVPMADGSSSERVLVAEPNLEHGVIANDAPERCRVDRISVESVIGAVDDLLRRRG
ncbi:MAG: glycosyltransferase family 9 protein [Planctomycetota bacterium]